MNNFQTTSTLWWPLGCSASTWDNTRDVGCWDFTGKGRDLGASCCLLWLDHWPNGTSNQHAYISRFWWPSRSRLKRTHFPERHSVFLRKRVPTRWCTSDSAAGSQSNLWLGHAAATEIRLLGTGHDWSFIVAKEKYYCRFTHSSMLFFSRGCWNWSNMPPNDLWCFKYSNAHFVVRAVFVNENDNK